MNILLLASRVPDPTHNGEDHRVHYLAKQLLARHSITLLAYRTSGGTNRSSLPFHRLEVMDRPAASRAAPRGLRRLISALSPRELFAFDPRFLDAVRVLVASERIDLLWVPAWEMFPYLEELSVRSSFVDVMDDGLLELSREIRLAHTAAHIARTAKRLFVTWRFERRYFPLATLCGFVSERDAAVAKAFCPNARYLLLPNGIDVETFQPRGGHEQYPSLIFEGNMHFAPNADAAVHFARDILPLVHEALPETTFLVVGRNPSVEVQSLACDRVVVTGDVPEVQPYLDRASVFVCPMRKGAGIKTKILQAWAMGKAVVATPLSAGGLAVRPGENIVLASGRRDFARAVIALLEDPARRREIGAAARETAIRHHSWEEKARLLEDTLLDIAPGSATRAARA